MGVNLKIQKSENFGGKSENSDFPSASILSSALKCFPIRLSYIKNIMCKDLSNLEESFGPTYQYHCLSVASGKEFSFVYLKGQFAHRKKDCFLHVYYYMINS